MDAEAEAIVARDALSPPGAADGSPAGAGDCDDGSKPLRRLTPSSDGALSRLKATIQAARYQGVELDPEELRRTPGEDVISAAALAAWAESAGMWARAVKIPWRHLFRFQDTGPVVLLFADGSAALQTGADVQQKVIFLKDPNAPEGTPAVAVDELRLREVWNGEAVLLRATRGRAEADAPFTLRWITGVVVEERRALIDIGIASFAISVLTVFPPLIVMVVVNRVLQYHSISTLVLLSTVLAIIFLYETLLGYARRLIITVIGARLDAKLNLHLFNRLLRLPLDFFERSPAGETMYRISQVHRVRAFITGKLLSTFLDLITLAVLLPIFISMRPWRGSSWPAP